MPDWWYWPRRLFSFEDTVAQWVMMVFTVVAALLLLKTLRATQEMAKDTRELGEAQVRAYVSFEVSEIDFARKNNRDGSNLTAKFSGVIKNFGNSPATNIEIMFDITEVALGSVVEVMDDGTGLAGVFQDFGSIPAGGSQNAYLKKTFKANLVAINHGTSKVRLTYVIRYVDVFGKVRVNHIESGTVWDVEKGGAARWVGDKLVAKSD